MAAVTYDGRSFMLDGRRLWLVSGTIVYARVPRAFWADRLHAARLAGLNAVCVPIFWNFHEPRPGHFDFKDGRDLRHFVQLAGQAGLHVILRPGPFVGGEWDLGGLPAWLSEQPGVNLRANSQPYLEACSRYITAVAEQVRDLQVTSPGKGGPILLVQNECGWTCDDDAMAHAYLGELSRYLHEAGFNVPVINANNLWQGVEGEIDTWVGGEQVMATLRQLAVVRPSQPRLMSELHAGPASAWGRASGGPTSPALLQRRLAEALAGAGQFNIEPFHFGGTPGFWGGRLGDGPESFAAEDAQPSAPLAGEGVPGGAYHAVRHLSTFASRFSRVLANLDPEYRPVVLDPGHTPAPAPAGKKASAQGQGLSVVHVTGSQGSVAFVFGDDPSRARSGASSGGAPVGGSGALLLPDGSSVPVELGRQSVVWCVFNAHLGGRTHLDYCNLCALGFVGRLLVCYGPAGAPAALSVNGAPLRVHVPRAGEGPAVIAHENITLVVLNEEQADQAYLTDAGLHLGVAFVRADGTPVPASKGKGGKGGDVVHVSPEGAVRHVAAVAPKRRGGQTPPSLGSWTAARASAYVDGSSARYASVPGPGSLTAMGSPFGYGWYRAVIKGGGHKARVVMPGAGDRLHLFVDGEPCGLVGVGPGGEPEGHLPLKKTSTLVVLAENLGRSASGARLHEPKGLTSHVFEARALRAGKPVLKKGAPVDLLRVSPPAWEVRRADATHPERITWSIAHRRKTVLVMHVGGFVGRGVVLVNDEPVRRLDRGGHDVIVLDPEKIGRSTITVQIALLGEWDHDGHGLEEALHAAGQHVRFEELVTNLTARAEWAFAKWEPPGADAFKPVKGGASGGVPSWWRAPLRVDDPAHGVLHLELGGLTKGQVYLNGRHLCRYFVATPDGTPVPPQERVWLPGAWLRAGENDLMLFDEHGGHPQKCRLAYDESARPITA